MIIRDAAACDSEIKIDSNLHQVQKAKENESSQRKTRLLTRNMIRRLEGRLRA